LSWNEAIADLEEIPTDNQPTLFSLIEEAAKKIDRFSIPKHKKYVERCKKTLDFLREKTQNKNNWSDLKSLNDLRKLRSCLDDIKNFGKIVQTLINLMDDFVQKTTGITPNNKEANSLKTEYWNSLNSVSKIALSNKQELSEESLKLAQELLVKSRAKLDGIFSSRQTQLLETKIEEIKK